MSLLGGAPPRRATAGGGGGGWLALLGTLLLLLLFVAFQLSHAEPPQFVLVVDAGSSGTRLFAYRWQPRRRGGGAGGLPRLRVVPPSAAPHKLPARPHAAHSAYTRVETEPGLDQYVEDMDGLQRAALGAKDGSARVPTSPLLLLLLLLLGPFRPSRAPACPATAGPLLQWAEAVVPYGRHKHTPIFLFGTAGLRRLSSEHQAQLLAGTRAILGSSSFR